jgi:hypothetical protein
MQPIPPLFVQTMVGNYFLLKSAATMRNILMFTAILACQVSPAQERFVSSDFNHHYDWFHNRSQVTDLYANHSTLFIFTEKATVYQGPCQTSATLATLTQGSPVTNIAYNDDYYLPEDEINGYSDIWYHVKGTNTAGQSFDGYVWGADIAKGWRTIDVSGDGKADFLMLGISSRERKKPEDIEAEIRIISKGKLIAMQPVPGLCIFEECAASPLLRVYRTRQGFTVVEASTMTVGCWAGLEKSFHYWDGTNLQRVYHAEFLTSTEFANESFVVNSSSSAQLCQYSHEDQAHFPVWSCTKIATDHSDRASASFANKEYLVSR